MFTSAASSDLAHVLTTDGWRIALHRYAPSGAVRRRHPVILCHGLACNRLAFDPHPEVSLARHLAHRGYLVLALELRGHGDSEHPAGWRRFDWTFDDYLLHDLPAAIAHARQVSGTAAIHWLGHSMGGILGYAHLARGGSADLRSVTAIGSSLDYRGSGSGFDSLLRLHAVLERVPAVPVHLLGRLTGRLVGRLETPFQRFNVWSSNTDPEVWRRISMHGFHAVSPPVMKQLATAFTPGGLRSRDGSVAYLNGFARATTPVLGLAGDRDAQCPPDAARRTLEAASSARRAFQVFGPAYGHTNHYGHFDLLIGRRARDEVFSHIDRWIDEHDAA